MSDTLGKSTIRSSKYYQTSQGEDRSARNSPRGAPTQGPSATSTLGPQEDKLEEPMAAHLKLPTFKGAVDEDMDWFWFVADSVWMAQGVVSDIVKRVQLSLAFK